MIDTIRDIAQAHITSIFGLMLYWLPLVICAVGYTFRTWTNVQKDMKQREQAEVESAQRAVMTEEERTKARIHSTYYSPTDTIGTLIGRAIMTFMPIGNLAVAVFDLAPKMFGDWFKYFDKLINIPLVPERKKRS